MNKLQQFLHKPWAPWLFFGLMIGTGIVQHYRVFSLDVIGYHSWRQTTTQTVIENFAQEDMNIFRPRLNDLHYPDGVLRMEFPLMQWLVALCCKLFGNSLIITRVFCFVLTIGSSIGIYKLVAQLTVNRFAGLLSAWFFFFAPIVYYYGVNPLPDNMALCAAIWALYAWMLHLKTNSTTSLLLSCVLFAIAVAVKLPFIVFGAMYLVRLFAKATPLRQRLLYLLFPLLCCLPALTWYVRVIGSWKGNGVVQGLAGNNKSIGTLLDYLQHNLVSTLPELLVNYATLPLFLIGLFLAFRKPRSEQRSTLFLVTCATLLYFLFELNMIAKVHDYYLMPFLPMIFLAVGLAVHFISTKNNALRYLLLLSFVLCPFTAYLRCNTRWNTYSPGFSKEYLLNKKQLQALIPSNGRVIVEGDESRSIVLYHLHRKGWSYKEHQMSQPEFEQAMQQGGHYLIFDCQTDEVGFIKPWLDALLFWKGDVKLYKLKQP